MTLEVPRIFAFLRRFDKTGRRRGTIAVTIRFPNGGRGTALTDGSRPNLASVLQEGWKSANI
jgi:hypothetical protein